MTKIVYNGMSDSYTLSSDDLKKAGVEGFTKTTFPRHEVKDIDDAAAQAITSNEGVFTGFPFAIVEDSEEGEKVRGNSQQVDEPDVPDLGEGAANEATGNTGKGTSTRGARSRA